MSESTRIISLVEKYRTHGSNFSDAVLADVQSKTLDLVDAKAVLEALAPKAASAGGVFSIKATDKGQVHIRGIRGINVKFGLPMYVEALEDLFANQDKIKAFISANNGKLARKIR